MTNGSTIIDFENLQGEVDNLAQRFFKIDRAIRHGIMEEAYEKAGEALKNNAIRKLMAATPTATRPNKTYGTSLVDNIRVTLWSGGGGATVSILGKGKKSTGFINRWFESGTDPRETKEGANRGVMLSKRGGPTYFFTNAIEGSRNTLLNILKEGVDKALNEAGR